jgi:hypothetical protein
VDVYQHGKHQMGLVKAHQGSPLVFPYQKAYRSMDLGYEKDQALVKDQ